MGNDQIIILFAGTDIANMRGECKGANSIIEIYDCIIMTGNKFPDSYILFFDPVEHKGEHIGKQSERVA